MIRAALTGGIATGKSYCLARFAASGIPTVDADSVARSVVEPGSAALAEIGRRFGPGVIQPDGTLDRQALGRIVFAERAARADLERIIHPRVYRYIEDWFGRLPGATPAALADIPLLYETGRERDFDVVIVAACDPEEQLRRLIARDGLSTEEALARIAAQMPIAEKVRRGDYVIDTGGTFAQTDAGVERVVRELHAGALR